MPSSYLIFDFAADEQSAQQARHKVEGWKQGFRLGDKMAIKFEREQIEEEDGESAEEDAEASAAKKQSSKSSAKHPGKKQSAKSSAASKTDDDEENGGSVRLFVRLNFSDHEKLSLQRWLDRIPSEEPFKSVHARIVRHGDPDFATTNELFEALS